MNRDELDKLFKKTLERANDTINLSNELKAAIESNDGPRLKKVQSAIQDRLEMYKLRKEQG